MYTIGTLYHKGEQNNLILYRNKKVRKKVNKDKTSPKCTNVPEHMGLCQPNGSKYSRHTGPVVTLLVVIVGGVVSALKLP